MLTAMNEPVLHFRASATHAICGAQLSPEDTQHPDEVNDETKRIVTCPKCRDIAIAPPNIEHSAGNFLL